MLLNQKCRTENRRAVAEGDQITVEVATLSFGNERTRIVDEIVLAQPQPGDKATNLGQAEQQRSAHLAAVVAETVRRGLKPSASAPPSLTAADILRLRRSVQQAVPRDPLHSSQAARTLAAADVEFFMIEPRVAVNGGPESLVKVFPGNLVFFYFPARGRYILSLLPRPDLGFARVGEVSGGLLKWMVNGDTFSVRSTVRTVPGDGPFWVYGLRDSGWLPVPRPNPDRILAGPVGLDEIRLLQRETNR